MLLVYGVVIVFALYVFVQFFAPTKRSRFVVETNSTTTTELSQARTDVIKQAITADQATTAAVDAKITADQKQAEAGAHASDIRTMAATDADTLAANGAGRSATATTQLAANEADKVLRDAEKEKRKAAQVEKKAEIEQKRLEKKQLIEQAKVAKLAVQRPSPEEKARLAALSHDEQQGEKQVAESQQTLLQDDIAAKKAEIDVLKAQLTALDDIVDTVEPPSITKRFGRFFR
jgi:hypothetical protein